MIAEPEGAPAKSLKNMVVPEKSDNALLILAVQPVTQNIGPTPADCTHLVATRPQMVKSLCFRVIPGSVMLTHIVLEGFITE